MTATNEPAPVVDDSGVPEALRNERDVMARLGLVLGRYGNIRHLFPICTDHACGDERRVFIVEFEKTLDAMAASRDLKCRMTGFSTLMVPVAGHQHGNRGNKP